MNIFVLLTLTNYMDMFQSYVFCTKWNVYTVYLYCAATSTHSDLCKCICLPTISLILINMYVVLRYTVAYKGFFCVCVGLQLLFYLAMEIIIAVDFIYASSIWSQLFDHNGIIKWKKLYSHSTTTQQTRTEKFYFRFVACNFHFFFGS